MNYDAAADTGWPRRALCRGGPRDGEWLWFDRWELHLPARVRLERCLQDSSCRPSLATPMPFVGRYRIELDPGAVIVDGDVVKVRTAEWITA